MKHCVFLFFILSVPTLSAQTENVHKLLGGFDFSSPRQFHEFVKKSSELVKAGQTKDVLGFFRTVKPIDKRRLLFRELGSSFVEHDPMAVMTWMEGNPDQVANQFDDDDMEDLVKVDPDRMLDFAKAHCPLWIENKDGPPRSDETVCTIELTVVRKAFSLVAKEDIDKALKHLQHWYDLDDQWGAREPFFSVAVREVADHWAKSSPKETFEYLQKHAKNKPDLALGALGLKKLRELSGVHDFDLDPKHANYSSMLVQGKFEEDGPEKTAQWLDTQGIHRASIAAYHKLARFWVDKDIDGAATWIRGMPGGERRDHAIQSFISSMWRTIHEDERYPKLMLEIAGLAGEEASLNFEWLYSRWFDKDPEAAMRSLAENPFVSEDRRLRMGRGFKQTTAALKSLRESQQRKLEELKKRSEQRKARIGGTASSGGNK